MLIDTVRLFEKAGLALKVLRGPMETGSPAIFQLDIHRCETVEYFRVWPGAGDISFSALDGNRDFRQVVLSVQEPRRPYERPVLKWGQRTREWAERQAAAEDGEVVRETGRNWIVRLWTPEQERRYLCGMDERTLFIAQIPAGNTVREAHDSLMPEEVRRVKAEIPEAVARQGEWFFLPSRREEIDLMLEYAVSHPRSARRDEPVGPGGHPHIADEVVRVDRRERRGRHERRHLDVYARGRIRHPDHCVQMFETWHRVVRNRAVLPAGPDRQRLRWID